MTAQKLDKDQVQPDKPDYCPIKADLTNRILAKFIDFLIASALLMLPNPVGFLAGLTYLLIADGMPPYGQSFGKKFIGLKVIVDPMSSNPTPCSWKKSMIRNTPFALAGFVFLGFIGILLFLVGLTVLIFELYFIFADDQGIRLGDIFANTKVLSAGSN